MQWHVLPTVYVLIGVDCRGEGSTSIEMLWHLVSGQIHLMSECGQFDSTFRLISIIVYLLT